MSAVEVLFWRECPSWPQAIAMVREEMESAGLDPDSLAVREIESESEAEHEGFVGSPTVRVGGRDVDPPRDEPTGLTCRVYRLRDGRVSPLPDAAVVREALSEGGS